MFIHFKNIKRLILILFVGISFSYSPQVVEISTENLIVGITAKGNLAFIIDKNTGVDYLYKQEPSSLLSIKNPKDTIAQRPISMKIDREKNIISLNFKSGAVVDLKVEEHDEYFTLELVKATPLNKVPAVVWGPYPISIKGVIGEVVGIARNSDFAIGLQSLNVKTTGGQLNNDEGDVPSRKGVASKTDFGCTLNAFAIDRTKERTADIWSKHFPNMPVMPISGESVVGSKIALFGCPPEDALATVGAIERAEGLPHPQLDGKWIKTHPERSKAYLITTFTEENFDQMLLYTKKAGMNAIYHAHPFSNWGHFQLIPEQFPNGLEGIKALVQKASAQGVRVGVHTLTNFITPNDPFITPTPNVNLALTGSAYLTEDIDDDTNEISVSSNHYFNNTDFDWMKTIKVGNELIRYRSVSNESPYRLLECQRGAFGTTPSNHKQGSSVGKLLDHPYRVFFPNHKLQDSLIDNLIEFVNTTGVAQIGFDGHEGAKSTGHGTYSLDHFATRMFDGAEHNLVNSSSQMTHNYWHVNHFVNWGEPWYAGFRESQTEYRFNNQLFLEENYLPNMLGWFSLTPSTSVEDFEWLLARSGGYNAGFALYANPESLRLNPYTDEILELVRIWEKARLSGAFDSIRDKLKDVSLEFNLKEISENQWNLITYQDYDFSIEKLELQPGQPTSAQWTIQNEAESQPFRTHITLEGEQDESINGISIGINNNLPIHIPEKLTVGQTLLIENNSFVIRGKSGNILIQSEINLPILDDGNHNIEFDFQNQNGSPVVNVKVRLDGEEQIVSSKK